MASTRVMQRRALLGGLCAAVGAVALPARAGSYLDRAALMVVHATRESDYLRARLSDEELAKVVHKLAEARVRAAKTMQVPKEVKQAHPHLLLMLENYEQSAEAATLKQTQRFLVYQERARSEERILRGVLKQLGWSLPKVS